MSWKWITFKHHLAKEEDNKILHPDAEEIYKCIATNHDNGLCSPGISNNIKLSKIGAPLKCDLVLTKSNEIVVDLYALRKGEKCTVDMENGHIVNHCLNNNEWFYLTDNVDAIQNALNKANIKENGIISIEQYINLIRICIFSPDNCINNKISREDFSRLMKPEGNIPSEINAQLYDYQKVGFLWMHRMLEASKGCILGDEMGLGKTLQVITVFQALKNTKNIPLLVIAPISLLENWKRECLRFAPKLNVFIHHGANRTGRYQELLKHDVVVISYNTAINDLSMLKMINWECIVLDEAQNIKNPYSERAKSVKSIPRKRSIAVTGTPFENHITDIWSLVDFVVPGLLGTLSAFTQNVPDDVYGAKIIEPGLSPIMLRRLVADVADDLPEKVIIPQPIQMSEEEKCEYEKYRQEAVNEMNGKGTVALTILQKLRMYCTHYQLCSNIDHSDPSLHSIKYQRFCEIVDEIISRDEKVLVFTSYKKMFDIFLKDIPCRFNIPIDYINGETPTQDRQRIVDEFNNRTGSSILILNPKAAGTGLNITGANHVIHYNLEWNPSLEDQSSARAYRRGQKKTVFIYRLFYDSTVEQIINERIDNKREIASTAVIGIDGKSDDNNDILKALQIAPKIQKIGLPP